MVAAVVEQVNAAGGVLGRMVRLVREDDETSPDAGVRAARKLIDVDQVSAIVGTWASAVTTAVAALCWESRTFLTTVSGADSITRLPHQGYVVRTQPNSELQGVAFARLMREIGARKPSYIGPQAPFTEPTIRSVNRALAPDGITMASAIYEPGKPSYRSEVDQALRANPDAIVAGGFTADTAVLLRDLYRAGFKGAVMGFAFAINDKFAAEQPREVTEGVYAVSPSPALDAPAYKAAAALLNRPEIDTYAAQVFDQANLVLLAMQLSGGSSGTNVRDAIRRVSQGDGPVVTNALEGLRALAGGAKELNYEGASGPCTFDAIGDVQDVRFRYERVQGGRLTLVRVG